MAGFISAGDEAHKTGATTFKDKIRTDGTTAGLASSRIENMMNFLTDQDWGWRPFLFLRPAKVHDISDTVLVKMAFCFGSTLAALLLLLRFLVERTITVTSVNCGHCGLLDRFFYSLQVYVCDLLESACPTASQFGTAC